MSIYKSFEQYDWVHLFNSYLKYVDKNSKVLEIGSSNLEKTIPLSEKCHSLIGIEKFKSRIIHYSQENIEIVHCSWEKLNKKFPKNYFDIAIASHVIEHVEDDVGNINQIYDVLKPNGIALLNTPNRTRLTRAIIEIFTGPKKFPWWEHVREYDYNSIHEMVKKTKFKKIKITPVVFGIHSGDVKLYIKTIPKFLIKYANYWEIELKK